MYTGEEIRKKREEVQENILKSFDNEFEKARHGRYADTPENRKLNRVGQEYGHKVQEEEKKPKTSAVSSEGGGKSLSDHAKNTDEETLKKVANNDKAPEDLRNAAKKELESRSSFKPGSDEDWDYKVKKDIKAKTTERLKKMLNNPNVQGSSFEKYIVNELKDRGEYNADDYKKKLNKTTSNKTSSADEYDKKNRAIVKQFFTLEDDFFENKVSSEEISKKMQKIISENKLSKKDFLRLYMKHGEEFTDGGGITKDDLKGTGLNTIDTFELKFSK